MKNYTKELELIANGLLAQSEHKPNYSKRDFMNATIIFQTALMDKMYSMQGSDKMPFQERIKMAESCGAELRKIIRTYTGLDTHKVEEFL
jgi:hypothetical protein